VSPDPLPSAQDLNRLLPHRDPFRFVDRVIRLEPSQAIVAEFDLRPEGPQFAGHFPGNPLMPGVLVAEALAQTSGLLLGLSPATLPAPPPQLYLAAVNLKFTQAARPGEILTLYSVAGLKFGSLFQFQVEAKSGSRLVAKGSLTLTAQNLAE
jgi:3-hydroxyacyl-[acyl-carrier-protein] dehydratase